MQEIYIVSANAENRFKMKEMFSKQYPEANVTGFKTIDGMILSTMHEFDSVEGMEVLIGMIVYDATTPGTNFYEPTGNSGGVTVNYPNILVNWPIVVLTAPNMRPMINTADCNCVKVIEGSTDEQRLAQLHTWLTTVFDAKSVISDKFNVNYIYVGLWDMNKHKRVHDFLVKEFPNACVLDGQDLPRCIWAIEAAKANTNRNEVKHWLYVMDTPLPIDVTFGNPAAYSISIWQQLRDDTPENIDDLYVLQGVAQSRDNCIATINASSVDEQMKLFQEATDIIKTAKQFGSEAIELTAESTEIDAYKISYEDANGKPVVVTMWAHNEREALNKFMQRLNVEAVESDD